MALNAHLPGATLNAHPYFSNQPWYNQLTQLLRETQLAATPRGFPFHYSHLCQGKSELSYDNYEFQETFWCLGRPTTVTIAYSNPLTTMHRYYTWEVLADVPGSKGYPSKVAVATVQAHPDLMMTDFRRILRKNPSVISHALAISMELGVKITLIPSFHIYEFVIARSLLPPHPRYVAYIATNNKGNSDLCHTIPY